MSRTSAPNGYAAGITALLIRMHYEGGVLRGRTFGATAPRGGSNLQLTKPGTTLLGEYLPLCRGEKFTKGNGGGKRPPRWLLHAAREQGGHKMTDRSGHTRRRNDLLPCSATNPNRRQRGQGGGRNRKITPSLCKPGGSPFISFFMPIRPCKFMQP